MSRQQSRLVRVAAEHVARVRVVAIVNKHTTTAAASISRRKQASARRQAHSVGKHRACSCIGFSCLFPSKAVSGDVDQAVSDAAKHNDDVNGDEDAKPAEGKPNKKVNK